MKTAVTDVMTTRVIWVRKDATRTPSSRARCSDRRETL